LELHKIVLGGKDKTYLIKVAGNGDLIKWKDAIALLIADDVDTDRWTVVKPEAKVNPGITSKTLSKLGSS